jgi:membrane-associated protease RseP (regulator of RpoE activity)
MHAGYDGGVRFRTPDRRYRVLHAGSWVVVLLLAAFSGVWYGGDVKAPSGGQIASGDPAHVQADRSESALAPSSPEPASFEPSARDAASTPTPVFDLAHLRNLNQKFSLREEYLLAQGLPRQTARDLVRRGAQLDLARRTLDLQAEQEGWGAAELRAARFQLERDLIAQIGADTYGLLLRSGRESSRVYVEQVPPGSDVERAGLKRGDRIVRYAGEPVFSRDDLEVLASEASGPVQIEIERAGELTRLASRPQLEFTTRATDPEAAFGEDTSRDRPVQLELTDPESGATVQVELSGSGRLSLKGGKGIPIRLGRPSRSPE